MDVSCLELKNNSYGQVKQVSVEAPRIVGSASKAHFEKITRSVVTTTETQSLPTTEAQVAVTTEAQSLPTTEAQVAVTTEAKPSKVCLGTFYITSYCSCPQCCGQYAYNRPHDEYGNEIVYGASGNVLQSGYSIAVDTSVIPFGTKVEFGGQEYIAQDVGGAIKGNRIDVYNSSHSEALNFPTGYYEVYVEE